jgi:DNA transposition AAA+ family ATPase
MKTQMVPTANIRTFWSGLDRIQTRQKKTNRIMLAFGAPGLGKTEAAAWYNINNGQSIFLRINSLVSPRSFLEDLVTELGEQPLYRAADLFKQAKALLEINPRLLLVDEADYLLKDSRCIETLRDLHDTTACSICIIGMEAMDRKLARFKHLVDRFAEVVRFSELTLADVKHICAQMADVRISDEAAVYIHKTAPRFRQVIANINKAESLAKINNLKEISSSHLEARR